VVGEERVRQEEGGKVWEGRQGKRRGLYVRDGKERVTLKNGGCRRVRVNKG
jgi:hypothetical protein